METFTVGPGNGWFGRLLGRNPLVRTSDRIEAWMLLLATVVVLSAVPVAGAIGTGVYSSRTAVYEQQISSWHIVTATVLQDNTVTVRPYSVDAAVHARWQDGGVSHDDTFGWDRAVKAGDRLTIWVDEKGDYAGPPTPPKRAAADAVTMGAMMWLSVVAAAAALIALVRFRLQQHRHAAWDRELRSLADDDGGRRNRGC